VPRPLTSANHHKRRPSSKRINPEGAAPQRFQRSRALRKGRRHHRLVMRPRNQNRWRSNRRVDPSFGKARPSTTRSEFSSQALASRSPSNREKCDPRGEATSKLSRQARPGIAPTQNQEKKHAVEGTSMARAHPSVELSQQQRVQLATTSPQRPLRLTRCLS
jgi:hypothetical protein